MKQKIKQIIESTETKAGRAFDFFIQTIIILSIISFTIETLPSLNDEIRKLFYVFEVVAVIIFTIEYILRIWIADSKLKYIFSFYGLIDFLAIIPFYLRIGIDLRSLRLFRLFRIFRLFKLFRFSAAIKRMQIAFKSIKAELLIFFIASLFLLYVSAVGIYYFERNAQPEVFSSIFHSLWWAVATLTTVGYGDIYPITIGGKVFTFIMLMIGLGIIAVPTALIASALTKVESKNSDSLNSN